MPTPFVFGKVPTRGDFVRAGRIGPLVDDLDAWLQRAVMAMRGPAPDGAPPVAFVFGRPQGLVAGALVPSRDSAGRTFPLVTGGTADGAPALSGSAVSELGPLLSAAVAAAQAVVGGTAPDEALALLRPPPAVAPTAPGPPAADLAPALAPFGQREAPRYGLSLPLPPDPAARAVAAGHWLDRVLAAGPSRPAASVLWAAAPTARAVVFAGPPSADVLAYLLGGAAVDGVYEVGAPTQSPSPA